MADSKLSAVATEATPSVGNERLYGVQDLAGSPTSVYHKLGDVMYYGADAPTTPEDNFLWHETDTGIIWRYGTYAAASRWVSVLPFSYAHGSLNSATSSNIFYTGYFSPPLGYDIYVDNFSMKAHVLTTNNGSNYWNLDLRKITGATVPASAAGTLLGAGLDTSAQAAGTWVEVSESINAVIDGTGASVEIPIIDLTKTGSPGNIWLTFGFSFRLVHP